MKKTLLGALPAMVFVFTALWLGSQAFRYRTAGPQAVYKEVAKVACMDGGRVMPLDSFARTRLSILSEKTEVHHWDEARQEAVFQCSALEWLLDCMDQPMLTSGPGSKYQVFRVDNDQLLDFLKLKPRPSFLRYSIDEIEPSMDRLYEQYETSEAKGPKKASLFDEKVIELVNRIEGYRRIVLGRMPQMIPGKDGGVWRSLYEMDGSVVLPAINDAERELMNKANEIAEKKAEAVAQEKTLQWLRRKYGDPDKIPEEVSQRIRVEIRAKYNALFDQELNDLLMKVLADVKPAARLRVEPAVEDIGRMARDQRKRDYDDLDATAAKVIEFQRSRMEPSAIARENFESLFNFLSPFYYTIFVYLFAGILLMFSWWFGRVECLTKSAVALMLLAIAYHTAALIARMYIQNRPPVTNLYSSAVFIGWGGVLLSLILYRFTRSELPLIAGSSIGAATLKIAQMLGNDGDTLGVLQAVLDTNFWLSIHVTTVTIGYTITYLAALLAALYIPWGIFFETLNQERNRKLGGMMYGTICAATLFSFFGTVAGGIWADESWGRFWGWDPKENGAVLVVLWNAMILHARWCGLVKQRGIAVLCIVGAMITTWSWFGTNQLGIGLHAYGFKKDLVDLCFNIWLTCIALIAFGCIPMQFWRSRPYGDR